MISRVTWPTSGKVRVAGHVVSLIELGAGFHPELTGREQEVLRLVAAGDSNKHIARKLGITERTVKSHLTSVYSAIGVTSRTQAALWATQHLTTDEPEE